MTKGSKAGPLGWGQSDSGVWSSPSIVRKPPGSPQWDKQAGIPWSRQVLQPHPRSSAPVSTQPESHSRKPPTAPLPEWIKIKMKVLVFLTPSLAASPPCFWKKRKTLAEPQPLTSLLIQWVENTLASTLNYYFGNPEKSYIPKYYRISGHLVNAHKLTDLRTSMNPSIRDRKKLCESTS